MSNRIRTVLPMRHASLSLLSEMYVHRYPVKVTKQITPICICA